VDYVIPSNDDAIRAIKLLSATVANAVLEGVELRKDLPGAPEAGGPSREQLAVPEMADEELLGEATLAKLMSGEFDEGLEAQATKAAAQEQPAADGAPVVEPAETKPQE
jgi:small subunit ribosomal protein S2